MQAYKLAIEQHRNFELRVPANISMPTSYYAHAEAMMHSSSGSMGQLGSSTDGMPAAAGGSGSGTQPGPDPNSQLAAVVAATAAAMERSHPSLQPQADYQSRRRSIGGMRYIRFQFRSVSSVGSHMAPAVSVPPALVSMDRTNYYWGTVDIPASSVHGEHMAEMGYTFGPAQLNGVSSWSCLAGCLVLS